MDSPSPVEMIPIISIVLSFAAAITIVVVIARSRTKRLQMKLELQSKLIEKFGSSAELATFLQSEAGKAFVNGVQSAPERMNRDRALGGIRIGIFFSAIGIAFLVLWGIQGNDGLAWPGVFMLVLGIAYFISAYSLMKLSPPSQPGTPQPPLVQ